MVESGTITIAHGSGGKMTADLIRRIFLPAFRNPLLEKLNEDQRAAFVLFEIEGNSGEEIAAVMGVPVNTVWARIHKARKKLQEQAERFEKRQGRGRIA